MKHLSLFTCTLILSLNLVASLVDESSKYYYEPVVLTGDDLPELIGSNIQNIVAYQHDEFEWIQIPVQIDEKHIQSWEAIKNYSDCRIVGKNPTDLVYADPKTFSGPDEDPYFDGDDEFVFMARHLGVKADPSIIPGLKSKMQDPLVEIAIGNGDTVIGYVYVFIEESNDFNEKLVDYEFKLTKEDASTGSHDYFDVYNYQCPTWQGIHTCKDEVDEMNPEDTWFRSPHYHRHFSQNWHSDKLHIFAGNSNEEDIWGMEEFQFILGNCGRCTKTFIRGPTAFVANINGPVRAIRSWVGANSGVITQRESIMYEQREEVITFLRVHSIPGIMDYINFEAGVPMKYYNCHNKNGFDIDGQMNADEDNFNNKFCTWEMVTGDSGTFLRVFDININWVIDIDPKTLLESWYYDNSNPSKTKVGSRGAPLYPNGFSLCSALLDGQQEAWGTMGMKNQNILPGVPNSDPTRFKTYDNLPPESCLKGHEDILAHLKVVSKHYYLEPEISIALAEELDQLETLRRVV